MKTHRFNNKGCLGVASFWSCRVLVGFLAALALDHPSLGETQLPATAKQQTAADFASAIAKKKHYPITGNFSINSTIDADAYEEFSRKAKEQSVADGKSLDIPPRKVVRVMRWSFAGNVELIRSGSDSDRSADVLLTEGGLLERADYNKYLVTKADSISFLKPSDFYFVGGMATPDWLSTADHIEYIDATKLMSPLLAKAVFPQGVAIVEAMRDGIFARVAIGSEGRIYAAEHGYGDTVLRSFLVSDFALGDDGQTFPKSARLDIFMASSERPWQECELTAKFVTFPATKNEIEECLEFVLPAGTEVQNVELGKVAILHEDTSGHRIIDGGVAFVEYDYDSVSPISDLSQEKNSYRFLFIAINALVVAFVGFLCVRKWLFNQ